MLNAEVAEGPKNEPPCQPSQPPVTNHDVGRSENSMHAIDLAFGLGRMSICKLASKQLRESQGVPGKWMLE